MARKKATRKKPKADVEPVVYSGPLSAAGRRSERVGKVLASIFDGIDDPDNLDLRRTLLLFRRATEHYIARMDEQDSPAFRLAARALWRDYEQLTAAGEDEDASTKLLQLGEWIERGVAEDAALQEVLRTAERWSLRAENFHDLSRKKSETLTLPQVRAVIERFMAHVVAVARRAGHEALAWQMLEEIRTDYRASMALAALSDATPTG